MNCKNKDGNDGGTEEVNGFIQCFVPTGDLNDVDFFRAEFARSLVEFMFPTLTKENKLLTHSIHVNSCHSSSVQYDSLRVA